MPVNLGNPTWMTLVADSATPAGQAQYAGRIIAIPADVPLPTGIDSITVSGVTLWGYARPGANGVEWVIQPAVDPNVAALNAIPGAGGWQNSAARQVYANLGLALLQLGVPGASVRSGFKQLYDAAVAEYQARNASA